MTGILIRYHGHKFHLDDDVLTKYTHTHTIHKHIHMHLYTFKWMHVSIYAHTYFYIFSYIYTYSCLYPNPYLYSYPYPYTVFPLSFRPTGPVACVRHLGWLTDVSHFTCPSWAFELSLLQQIPLRHSCFHTKWHSLNSCSSQKLHILDPFFF